ncbi:MAG: DUF4390 domain-containing protein [Burkholderiaceae bacterium]
MPCCTSLPPEGRTRRRALAALLCAGLDGLPSAAWAAAPGVQALRVERSDDEVLLYAELSFELATSVQDALLKGIPVHFVAEAKVLRERWYWFDQELSAAARFTRVAYQPLTRHWRLTTSGEPINDAELGLGLSQQYESLDEVMAAVRRIAGWRIASAEQLAGGGAQLLQFQFRLDASQLPRTFQLGGLRQSDWQLSLERRQPLELERTP